MTFVNRARWEPGREEKYQKARALDGNKRLSAEALARRFGRFDVPKLKVEEGVAPSARITLPSSLFDGLKDATLEVRVELEDQSVWAGFDAADLLIYTR